MKKSLFFFVVLLLLVSCGKKAEPEVITPEVQTPPAVEITKEEVQIPVNEKSTPEEKEFSQDLNSVFDLIDDEASILGTGTTASGQVTASGVTSTGVVTASGAQAQ